MKIRSTTILSVRRGNTVAIGSDGQATQGSMIAKNNTRKLHKFLDGKVIVGFAGSIADAAILLDSLESALLRNPDNTLRAAVEHAKEVRLNRATRSLRVELIVVSATHTLILPGSGYVIEPDDHLAGTGSGSPYALAAAKALLRHSDLNAAEIVRESLKIASEFDVYTNDNFIVEELPC
ncbi:MAG: ATP-dependent protease subunit HslV [Planctomycetia bacterium]|nr:ATP-dependent protease subunit HslV [Planctomycetia bacterium]